MLRFIALGGDGRTNYMVSELSESGFLTVKSMEINTTDASDAVILPLPYTADNIRIKGTDIKIYDLIDSLDRKQIVFIGKADKAISDLLSERKIQFYDYNAREEFAQKNAVPTAQGVLEFVLQNINVTVSSLKVTVVGYGRCGKAICRVFNNLGAEVTSVSRRYATLADAESEGINACHIKDIDESVCCDVIINTVPSIIFDSHLIDIINNKTLLVDVSSYPYGFDMEYAEMSGKKVNILPSLPGKCVPESAGKIIAETIINIIEEGGLWKKSN